MGSFNKKNLFYTSMLFIAVTTTVMCNNKARTFINAYVVDNSVEWDKIKGQNIDTSNCVKVRLQFLNNPYKFNASNSFALHIDQVLIFKGDFNTRYEMYLPVKFFNERVIPSFAVYEGSKAYNFIHKKSMFFNSNDRYLYIVFCPDNELTESCYLFSQQEAIL